MDVFVNYVGSTLRRKKRSEKRYSGGDGGRKEQRSGLVKNRGKGLGREMRRGSGSPPVFHEESIGQRDGFFSVREVLIVERQKPSGAARTKTCNGHAQRAAPIPVRKSGRKGEKARAGRTPRPWNSRRGSNLHPYAPPHVSRQEGENRGKCAFDESAKIFRQRNKDFPQVRPQKEWPSQCQRRQQVATIRLRDDEFRLNC